MILTGYLGGTFAVDRPLSLSASICFEQSYDGIEGDSASSTELYALLSALAGVPIKQGIAVTGSVNQRGMIQPIGGVNFKIEGFFAVCKSQGLTGHQGVMIPKANERHLMLNDEVMEAVAADRFHIWSVTTIEEGIEILTGIKAGKRDNHGNFPKKTLFHLVDKRLSDMAELMRDQDRKHAQRSRRTAAADSKK
jgi:predicted ATP-dependent protease